MTWMIFDTEKKKIKNPQVKAWLDPENMPSWRRASGERPTYKPPEMSETENTTMWKKGKNFLVPPAKKDKSKPSCEHALEIINMALLLRRPLLVTGEPHLFKRLQKSTHETIIL